MKILDLLRRQRSHPDVARDDDQPVSSASKTTAEILEIATLKHNIRKLEAKLAAREHSPAIQRLREHQRRVRETLLYLPSHQGKDFARGIVAGEFVHWDLAEAFEEVSAMKEALNRLGEPNLFLDLDHDFRTKMFHVDRFYLRPNEGIYCEGRWTAVGLHLRPRFRGVSPACIPPGKKFPVPKTVEIIKRRQWEEIQASLPEHDTSGCLGAVCINCMPVYPDTNKLEHI